MSFVWNYVKVQASLLKPEAYCIKLLPESFFSMVKSMVNLCLPEFSEFTRVFFSGKSFMQWAPEIRLYAK